MSLCPHPLSIYGHRGHSVPPHQVSPAASWHHLNVFFYASEVERGSGAFQESKHRKMTKVLQLAKPYKQRGGGGVVVASEMGAGSGARCRGKLWDKHGGDESYDTVCFFVKKDHRDNLLATYWDSLKGPSYRKTHFYVTTSANFILKGSSWMFFRHCYMWEPQNTPTSWSSCIKMNLNEKVMTTFFFYVILEITANITSNTFNKT